jgi:hypothetical protein
VERVEAEYFSDDDDQPTLQRSNTFTQYHENAELEWGSSWEQWQQPSFMLIMPLAPSGESGDLTTGHSVREDAWTPWPLQQRADAPDVLIPLQISHENDSAEEQDTIGKMLEHAQLQAEARAAQESALLPRRRKGNKHLEGMSRASFVSHVNMLAHGLEAGGSAQEEALAAISLISFPLSLDVQGCRLLQDALEVADVSTGAQLTAGLQGHVRELINSPHGNYVIQKVIEVLPVAQASFVAQELLNHGANVARHRFGCRIICRLLEHFAGESLSDSDGDARNALLNEVIEETSNLSRHAFGHHVIQSIIEHGMPAQRDNVIRKVSRDLHRNLKNRSASFVIEKILVDCPLDEHKMILERLANSGEDVKEALARGGRTGARISRALKNYLGETTASSASSDSM